MQKWGRRFAFTTLLIIIGALVIASVLLLMQFKPIAGGVILFIKTIFSRGFGLYIILISIVIFLENKDPGKTMAWLLILFLLPGVGFVFYVLFGRNYRNKWRIRRKIRNEMIEREQRGIDTSELNLINYYKLNDIDSNYDYEDLFDEAIYNQAVSVQENVVDHINLFGGKKGQVSNRLLNLLLKNSKSMFTLNNNVEVLTDGEATYAKMLEYINKAKEYIHLECFIIRNDKIGNIIKNALIKKANEGVHIRVIYDSVGCWKLGKKYVSDLTDAGAEVYPFFPVAIPILSRELNYRNHRKILVVDGKYGFVGGLNIGDEYLGEDPKMGFWRDTHLFIEGESVYSLHNVFLDDWKYVSKKRTGEKNLFPKPDINGHTVMQITSSGPDTNVQTIHQAFFTMISTAERRIWITTPYLVPDQSVKMALKTAALSGLDVRIIIPSTPDHFFVYWASQDNIQELLEAGVKIYKYEKGFVHSKILLIDGICSTVGTANLDIRSFEMNFEINAFIYDESVVERLEVDFKQDMSDSTQINYDEFAKRGVMTKFLEALGRLVSPLQ